MIDRIAGSRLALAGLFLLALLIGAAAMWGIDRLSPAADRAQIESVVHDYVLAHPEIVPEAIQKLQDQQVGSMVAANRDAITTPVGSAWAGNPKADVTLVEYFDYDCGYCRASMPMLAELLKDDPKLRIVYRDYPVLTPESETAARWSLAAAKMGKFAAFHDALFAGGPVSDASMIAAAKAAGIDPAKLRTAAADPAIEDDIQQNLAVGRQLGMTGTPSWVIGNRVISGALPIDRMKQLIADARTADPQG
ncbi:DsbA family protein [Hephaestia mangrovi]|uniref:DsbA family protein n=1 Tax=Hephaestia mangrovi TaxID=2873268 RepID=UPI001CA7720A|nr:DsbA family protein [Hephaestia mangrovi]MBY8826666.1 DsbA family protein [Hephaestia mangrovi]